MIDRVVMLTGASGLLGTLLLRTAPDCEIVGLVHRRRITGTGTPFVSADLRDAEAVRAVVKQVRPSLIVHAAYAKDRSSIVDATEHVVDAASSFDTDVLFISTDAVFSGDGVARDEDATPDPIWDYGRWKAEAEGLVMARSASNAILRLPLIVSIDPDDHVVDGIRASANRGEATWWFGDEIRQPAVGSELAEAVWRIALLDAADRAGAWHLPGPESLSRFQIAQRVVAVLGLDQRAVRADRTPADAQRPRALRLRDERARQVIGWSPSAVLS